MRIINTVKEMKEIISANKAEGKSVGFVPTMGYLHEGHISLVNKARKENDIVAVSIFVNPTQFNAIQDLNTYPRDLDRDLKLLTDAFVDFVFVPSVEEMYPKNYSTYVDVEGSLTKELCGKSREGHFKGVATVVMKLFNIVKPHKAYFGQKDAQQVAVIQQMAEDMNLDVMIIPCPIVREADGLALSSRNSLLTELQRKDAVILSQSLFKAREAIEKGERNAAVIKKLITANINTVAYAEIDYVEIVNARTLGIIEKVEGEVLIALAVKMGAPRLIDNIRMVV